MITTWICRTLRFNLPIVSDVSIVVIIFME